MEESFGYVKALEFGRKITIIMANRKMMWTELERYDVSRSQFNKAKKITKIDVHSDGGGIDLNEEQYKIFQDELGKVGK